MWSRVDTTSDREKSLVLDEVEAVIDVSNYAISESDLTRPWGAYFKISQTDTEDFLNDFFSNINFPSWSEDLEMDPKILVLAPGKRLSWQYHKRRAESWSVISGPVGIMVSDTNSQPKNPKIENEGGSVFIPKKGRHRLVGLDNWAIVAEIWIHTDSGKLSNEADEVRVQDDFGRKEE